MSCFANVIAIVAVVIIISISGVAVIIIVSILNFGVAVISVAGGHCQAADTEFGCQADADKCQAGKNHAIANSVVLAGRPLDSLSPYPDRAHCCDVAASDALPLSYGVGCTSNTLLEYCLTESSLVLSVKYFQTRMLSQCNHG